MTVGRLLALRVQCRELRRRPAFRLHAKQRASPGGKHDDVVAVPRASTKPGGLTHDLSRASVHVDPLQLAFRQKTHESAVRFPERAIGAVSSLQLLKALDVGRQRPDGQSDRSSSPRASQEARRDVRPGKPLQR